MAVHDRCVELLDRTLTALGSAAVTASALVEATLTRDEVSSSLANEVGMLTGYSLIVSTRRYLDGWLTNDLADGPLVEVADGPRVEVTDGPLVDVVDGPLELPGFPLYMRVPTASLAKISDSALRELKYSPLRYSPLRFCASMLPNIRRIWLRHS